MYRDALGIVGVSAAAANTVLGIGAGLVQALLGSPEIVVAMASLLSRIPFVEDLLGPAVVEAILSVALVAMFFIYLMKLGERALNNAN